MTSPKPFKHFALAVVARLAGCLQKWSVHGSDQYCHDCRTVKVYDGYTRAQLSEAFDSVKCPANWKSPIDATLLSVEQDYVRLVDAAIVFYTGSKPVFEITGQVIRVTAPGYWSLSQ